MEVFGMANRLVTDVHQGVVEYATAKWLLLGAVPAVVVGALLEHVVPASLLTLTFGAGLVPLGPFLVFSDPLEAQAPRVAEGASPRRTNAGRGTTAVRTRTGETFTDEPC